MKDLDHLNNRYKTIISYLNSSTFSLLLQQILKFKYLSHYLIMRKK